MQTICKKNIFRKNIIAIRTLQQIEREKRPATPEELQALKEYADVFEDMLNNNKEEALNKMLKYKEELGVKPIL